MKIDFVAIELISIYPVFAEWVNTKLGGRGTGEVMPLWSIPDLGITTKSVTIAVGGKAPRELLWTEGAAS